MSETAQENCPCGSGKDYASCCGPYHQGSTAAPTAEKLMRSRYCAFAKNNFEYLNETTHSGADHNDSPHNRELYSQFEWQGLEILDTENGQESDADGYVDFVARYRVAGGDHVIREKSYFLKENGKWFYKDGKSLQAPGKATQKLGRNDPCSCGSGKKYKKCCMN